MPRIAHLGVVEMDEGAKDRRDVHFVYTISTKQELHYFVRIRLRGVQHEDLEQILDLSTEQFILL